MIDAMQISRSGMDVEWQRLQVIAQNLANLNTSRTADGQPYHPLRLVSGPDAGFGDMIASKTSARTPSGVKVFNVEAEPTGVRRVYDPNDPEADAQGFVSMPMIDHVGEMTLLIRTSRSYAANLTALSIENQMAMRALDLGGRS